MSSFAVWRRTSAASACVCLILSIGVRLPAQAQAPGNGDQQAIPEIQRRQAEEAERQASERDRWRQQQLQKATEAPPRPDHSADQERLPPDEAPCFPIQRIELRGAAGLEVNPSRLEHALAGPSQDDPPLNRCLGELGINRLMTRLQDVLIGHGHTTSKVLAPPQDLASGVLVLQVLPGRIGRILHRRQDPRARFGNALPADEGDVLWLPDLDQGLENLQRVPTVQADIQITPGTEPMTSDLLIEWAQPFPLRLNLTADDGGSAGTGKYQGSATVSHDHALAQRHCH